MKVTLRGGAASAPGQPRPAGEISLLNFLLPFQFAADGAIVLATETPAGEGVQVFIKRYVQEWIVWHRAGCRDFALCDLAAFRTAAIHCHYLGNAAWKDARKWLIEVFGISDEINFMEFCPEQITDKTRRILRLLGPTTLIPPAESILDKDSENELLMMACPVEHFLILGGDNRLMLDPETLLNGYGCRPFPRPEAVTFSSSTATSISKHAFDVVEKRRQSMLADAIRNGVTKAANKLGDEVRKGIAGQLGTGPKLAQTVLSSSGTDSFLITQGLLRLVSDAPLISLMVGAEESGAGVPLAAQERHFAVKAAMGAKVEKGQSLGGRAKEGEFIAISLQEDKSGTLPGKLVDERVRQLTEENVAKGSDVVIYAMNHSKLGRSGPSTPLLLKLKKRFGDRLQVVVDACQMRLDLDELHQYLKHGFLVIVTGSKFFTGPPLSGAVLIPRQMITRVLASKRTLPESFNAYCATYDLPTNLRKILAEPKTSFNIGSFFRWVAAIAEMKRYFNVPPRLRKKALDDFSRRVEKCFRSHDSIELLDDAPSSKMKARTTISELSGRRMIFPFFLMSSRGRKKEPCSEAQVREIYALLNQDCSGRFASPVAREYRLFAQRCHIGQPVVACHHSGKMSAVLRLSIGARVISESWSESSARIEPELIEDEIWQVSVVLDKIELLLGKIAAS